MSQEARSAATHHADVILRVLAAEATTPEPDSWGGERAAARDSVFAFVAEIERLCGVPAARRRRQ